VRSTNLNWGFPLMHGNPVNPEWEPWLGWFFFFGTAVDAEMNFSSSEMNSLGL